MWLPSLFVLLVYVSGYIFLLFGAVCLASGLYWLVELAEENTTLAKKLLRGSTITLLVLHVLLLLYERFPALPTLNGLASHLIYYQLLQAFPFVEPRSALFGLSAVGFVASNVLWYRFFASDVEIFYRYGVAPLPAVAAFFLLVVWLVPGAFFVSLTVNEAVLPGAGVDSLRGVSPASSGSRLAEGGDRKRGKNVVLAGAGWVMDFIKQLAGYQGRGETDPFAPGPRRQPQHDWSDDPFRRSGVPRRYRCCCWYPTATQRAVLRGDGHIICCLRLQDTCNSDAGSIR
ncbi:hypothetical protein BU14_0136s0011 [Porphyra umbilicalis]|uniref:Protein TEX261 n=1 Tax=Porphyra umbilicalis TaxID=2786 RepID=A0A1X6PAQ0_PORUM|nr:hypothetical protein BU14_0136s0011 [Porphyra umbilicalis]|eukprot:OSX77713.1 hypothetical protein BU14_0136s0011 [Porphyra umbilicalis]